MLLGETEKKSGREVALGADATIPAAITDSGCERDLNEDRYAVVESASGLAWLVCDGMGGSTGGELAAQLAIDAIRRHLENMPARSPEIALRDSVSEANRVIVLRRQNQAFSQMGTTIVAALFTGQEIVVGHVGDSRAYLIRDGAIQQLTTDHTYVQELVERGQIKPEDALSHPQAHILTRCIGSEPVLEFELQKYWIWETKTGQASDILLLCTDGLYSLISEGEVAAISSQESPQMACVKLVELAKERGGYDNISVAIIPLAGQLRQEPPPGYSEAKAARLRRSQSPTAQAQAAPRSFWRIFLVVTMLSVLSALLTVLLVTISISR